MPAGAARRAVRLLHTLDPAGHAARAHRRQPRGVAHQPRAAGRQGWRLCLSQPGEDPRRRARRRHQPTFNVNRAELLAALTTATTVTAATRHPRCPLEPGRNGVLDVVLRADSGATMHTTHVTHGSGGARHKPDPQPGLRAARTHVPRRRQHRRARARRPAADLPERPPPPRHPHADRHLIPTGPQPAAAVAGHAPGQCPAAPRPRLERGPCAHRPGPSRRCVHPAAPASASGAGHPPLCDQGAPPCCTTSRPGHP